MPIKDFDGN